MTTPAPGTLEVKSGDHEPSVQSTLTLPGSATPLTLAGTTVYFIMRAKGPDGKPVGGAPFILAAATIVGDPADNVVRYDWQDGDTDTPGEYLGEFEVWRNGRRRTFPTRGYNDIVIWQDMGQGAAPV